ncbi:MAG TPA: hypothetical protein VGF48_15230 [Thermoanaerobaculia bacterium]|jgi:hypothetical protein
MKRILPLLFAAFVGLGCYSDNASPQTHGAHNKPSDVTGGNTTVDQAPATASGQTTTGANDSAGGATTTYGGQAGGAQTSPKQ